MPWGDYKLPRRYLERMFPNTSSTLETGPQTPGLIPWPVYSLFGLHSNSIPHVSPRCYKGVLPAASPRSPAALLLDSLPSLQHGASPQVGFCLYSACACSCKDGEGRLGREAGQQSLSTGVCPVNGSLQSLAEGGTQAPTLWADEAWEGAPPSTSSNSGSFLELQETAASPEAELEGWAW